MVRLWARTRPFASTAFTIIALLSVGAQGGVQAMIGDSDSALANGDFESASGGRPEAWKVHKWNGQGEFAYVAEGRGGGHCVAIESKKGADFSWETFVGVKPFSKYRLSGWIKTDDVVATTGQGALINLHAADVKTQALTGTNDWTHVEVEFETAEDDTVHVNCLFGGWGLATGRAWYDDVAIELIETRGVEPGTLVFDATKTGAPISKYIYGQFIEHLGRCIYGGIWAEMLEDRKFFYAVGTPESPWKIAGAANAVRTVAKDWYEGGQAAEIRAGGHASGLVQEGLGLRKGRSYVGRIVLAGDAGAGPVEVCLAWGPGEDDAQTSVIQNVSSEYQTSPLTFSAEADTDNARLTIAAKGSGAVRIGTVSLMPADNVHGMRADTLALLRDLASPVYRWPGGNFVSGYDWRDGIGDPDRRPPRKNPAWTGIEHNDFGIDEYMVFCREVDTEPLVVVNSGQGDMQMAIEELEYANGAADSPMGKLRAQHGHAAPYGVHWWGIGNEMYGGWQLGHMPLEEYVKKHNTFADALRAADPSIKLIAVGATGPWSETMLGECADHMDLLSEHFYVGDKPGLVSHVRQMNANVKAKAVAHRHYHETIPALRGKHIPIALDEWNYWYGEHLYGELGVRYFQRDALGVAAGLNEMTRHSDVFFMANYAQTVNVIGAIKTSKTDAAFATTGLPLMLYRRHYGTVPIEVTGQTGLFDVAAAWTEDRKAITIAVVNPTDAAAALAFTVKGATLTGDGTRWLIAADDYMAYNEPGRPPRVLIVENAVSGIEDALDSPPYSVALYRLGVR